MKKYVGVIAIICAVSALLVGCTDAPPTADQTQSQQQAKLLNEATRQTAMPAITNFTERKELKTILEERDKANLITYLYTQNQMDGKWVYQGEAIGFPLPYSTEYTNPSYVANWRDQVGYAILPQADPNGLFSSQNTQADWIMAINPETNKPEPEYMEPNVVVKESKIPANLCESWSLPKGY